MAHKLMEHLALSDILDLKKFVTWEDEKEMNLLAPLKTEAENRVHKEGTTSERNLVKRETSGKACVCS